MRSIYTHIGNNLENCCCYLGKQPNEVTSVVADKATNGFVSNWCVEADIRSLGEAMTEKDIYRDTPVRLLGYANEVGEAFRPLIHVNWVRLSYGIASAYVLADTLDKTLKMSKHPFVNDSKKYYQVFIAGIDTLVWQSFASVIIPGITINRMCALSLYMLKYTIKLPSKSHKLITTGIGLACIPLIIKPIDLLVDFVMDETFRKAVGTGKCQP